MPKNELEKLEYIEEQLLKIRDIISLEDAYHVSDAIVISINDDEIEEHIKNMLISMGYDNKIISNISRIIKKIQNKK